MIGTGYDRVFQAETSRKSVLLDLFRGRGVTVEQMNEKVRGSGILLAILLALVAATACAQSPEVKKQKAVARGEQYLKDGKVNEAIIEFRTALQVDQNFVPAAHGLGRAYLAKSWYGDAGRELLRAQKLSPDSLSIATDLGRVLVQVGAWKDAEAQATVILGKEPQNKDGLHIRVSALLGQGRTDEALSLLEKIPAGETPPDLGRAAAAVLFRLGKVPEAEQALRATLAKNPQDALSLAGLGGIRLSQNQPAEALKLYGQAIAIRPDDPKIRQGLAVTQARLGHLPEAIKELEGIDPRARSADSVMTLGAYYIRTNRSADAVRLLAPMVERAPRFAEARYLLSLAYLASNEPTSAIAQLEELQRQVPDNTLTRFRLAVAYSRGGRPREALAQLDPLAKAMEKTADYQVERGHALLLMGRFDEALAAASAAQRLAPQSPQIYLLMGQIQARRRDVKAARQMFARAAELDATYVPARLALGQLSLAEKDPDAAAKEFDAAVQANPKSLPAVQAKVSALVAQKRIKEAIQVAESAVKTNEHDSGFHALLGGLYLADNQNDKATLSFRRSLELDPKSLGARLGLARVAIGQKRDEEAIGHLQAVLKDRPDQPIAVLLLTSLYEKAGQYDQALPVLEAALKASPRQAAFGLQLGDLYLKKGRYDNAIALMTDLLSQYPDLAEARLIRGQAYLTAGKGDAALQELLAVVKANPKVPAAHYFLARTYTALGRVPEAQAEYREALKLNPQFDPAKNELAALSGQKPEENKQIEQMQSALKNDPKNVVVREALARALLRKGQVKDAQAELKTLLDQAPAHAEANFLMAQILGQQGKVDEAANHLRATLRANPSHVGAHVQLGSYLDQKGQSEQALAEYEAALRVNPNLRDVKLLVGVLYAKTGRLPDALRLARELEQSAPKSPGPPLLRGTVLLAQNNPQGAVDAFNAALKLKSDLTDGHRGLGQAHQQLGQIDQAVESYRRALALNDKDVVSLNNLAWILAELRKKLDEALPLATKAEQIAPNSPEVLDTLGWIHYRRGAYADAEKSLSRAADKAPANGAIRYHLGMAYAGLGRKADAVSALRRAAQLDPKLAQSEKIDDLIKQLGG
jgi:tetratricopeptide (TPR) repeat protein